MRKSQNQISVYTKYSKAKEEAKASFNISNECSLQKRKPTHKRKLVRLLMSIKLCLIHFCHSIFWEKNFSAHYTKYNKRQMRGFNFNVDDFSSPDHILYLLLFTKEHKLFVVVNMQLKMHLKIIWKWNSL